MIFSRGHMKTYMLLAALGPFVAHADLASDFFFEDSTESSSSQNSKDYNSLFYISDNSQQAMPEPIAPSTPDDYTQKYCSIVELGPSYTHGSIKINNQPLYHGNLGGAQAIYEYKPLNYLYLALSSTYKQGSMDNSLGYRSFLYFDTHERIGYTVADSSKRWIFSFYTGVGYRHYGHDLHQSSTKINFDYNSFYVPVGLKSSYRFNTWITGALNFMYMPQVNSTVKIDPLDGARWCLEKTFSNFLVEVPITFFFTHNRRYSVSVKPFYEYWEDGSSTASVFSQSLGLPGNCYNFWGAEVNFGFSF